MLQVHVVKHGNGPFVDLSWAKKADVAGGRVGGSDVLAVGGADAHPRVRQHFVERYTKLKKEETDAKLMYQ